MAWTDIDFAAPGSVPKSGGLTALAGSRQSSDVFSVGADGSVQVTSFEPGTAWVTTALAGPGSASLTAGLAAILKPQGREVWWVGVDGSVQAAYVEGGAWTSYTLAAAGSASLTGAITAISKGGHSMEVWWVGPDGSIQAAYHEGSWDRYLLAGEGSAALTGQVTAVSKGGNVMEVWWVGPDGSVQASYFEDGWNGYTLSGAGSASVTGGITAVWKGGDSMEVWWVGPDGSVSARYHEGPWNSYTLSSAGSASVTGGITAVWKGGDSMEVWWVGPDGSVRAAYHESGWSTYTLAGTSSVTLTSRVAAAARTPASISTFWASEQGALREGFTVPVALECPITTGAEFDGSLALYLDQDGSTTWRGHARAHGAAGYEYGVSAFVRGQNGLALTSVHTGAVHGIVSPGSADDFWEEAVGPNPALANRLADYRFGTLEVHTDYTNTTTGFFLRALDWVLELGVGLAVSSSGVGLIVTVGAEAGSLVGTGSLVAGARILGSNMWLGGPDGMLLSIGVDSLARIGNNARGLTHDEYQWANRQVYDGSLPPMDRLLLTDSIGGNDRPFTFQRWDGQITLNLGQAGFSDPRQHPHGIYGQTFVHELLHACQIQHSQNLRFTLAAILAQGGQVLGGNPYEYGPAGPDYTSLGIEQQAQIVSDWYAGAVPLGTNQTTTPRDVNSPYFRYILENVRTGKL